jgi:hypothetical protein
MFSLQARSILKTIKLQDQMITMARTSSQRRERQMASEKNQGMDNTVV